MFSSIVIGEVSGRGACLRQSIAKAGPPAKLSMGAGGGLGKALFNPLGHEKVSVVGVAGAAVKLVGGDVRSHDFEVNGPDIAGSCLVLDKLESLASPALAAMGLREIELIDKGVATE